MDQIWTSNHIIQHLLKFTITNAQEEFKSDYKIISISIESYFLTHSLKKPKVIKKLNTQNTNKQTWKEIKLQLSKFLETFSHPKWNTFENKLKKILKTHI